MGDECTGVGIHILVVVVSQELKLSWNEGWELDLKLGTSFADR